MAAHENLAGGLIGLGGALFAAWLAYSGAQDQIRGANAMVQEAARLKAEEKYQEVAQKIDALSLAKGYLNSLANNFPDEAAPEYTNFDFVEKLAFLHSRALVYLSESAAEAPNGFGRSIKTVMWRAVKLAEKIVEDEKSRILEGRKFALRQEIRLLVEGVRKIESDIDALLPSLHDRLENLLRQFHNLGGGKVA
jgi:hypothetical protein